MAESLTLNLGAEIGYNQQSDYLIGTYSDWHHGEVNAALDWAIHDQITITPMVRFSTGLSTAAENEYVSWYPLDDVTAVSLKANLSW